MINLIASLLCLIAEDNQLNQLVKKTTAASLATMYKDIPFNSLTPYALDKNGNPIILISKLAIHTKNLDKNANCSLMVSKIDKTDVFNSQRVTFIGKMKKVTGKEVEEVKKIYLKKYPDAEGFLELEDFAFYRMDIDKIYYVGGFGDIEWIEKSDYVKQIKEE
jgi:putative heme iron utilization protein